MDEVINMEPTIETRPDGTEYTFDFDATLSKLYEERNLLRRYVHPSVAEEISVKIWGRDVQKQSATTEV